MAILLCKFTSSKQFCYLIEDHYQTLTQVLLTTHSIYKCRIHMRQGALALGPLCRLQTHTGAHLLERKMGKRYTVRLKLRRMSLNFSKFFETCWHKRVNSFKICIMLIILNHKNIRKTNRKRRSVAAMSFLGWRHWKFMNY
jgi:hypothetical protein